MKIGIDIRCLTDGKRTGVEEYTINILQNLFEIDKKNEYILFLNSYHQVKFDVSIFDKYKNVKIKKFNFPNKLLNFSFWYFGFPYVDRMIGGVDVFFMPNINFIALSKKTKLILTIHDLSYEIYPENFSLKRRLWHLAINPRKLCLKADKIIAVSESTKQDIINYFKIYKYKIHKIYNAVDDNFFQLDRNDRKLIEVKEKYHLPFNFIFFLGTIEPRKNISSVIKAFDHLKSIGNLELDKYKLVIAGTKGWKTSKILDLMRNAKYTNDIIYTSCITPQDKAAVYTLASLFVYPSFFEGFGIPILEAMKCRVPVIASNNSAIPEVIGDGGIMIDSDKTDELYKAMRDMLLDKNLREKIKNRAIRQSMKFSWKSSATKLSYIIGNMLK